VDSISVYMDSVVGRGDAAAKKGKLAVICIYADMCTAWSFVWSALRSCADDSVWHEL